MTLFLIGIVIFFGAHLFTAFARDARSKIIGKIGEGGFKAAYSLVSLAGLALIVAGWGKADVTLLYAPPAWLRHVTYALMAPALIFLVAAYAPAGKMAAAVKHPMLAGVKIWAFAHLLSNGEARSAILFGGFLAFAVIDRIAVKKRGVPVRAAGPAINDAIAIGAGLVLYAAIALYLHQYIAGVRLF